MKQRQTDQTSSTILSYTSRQISYRNMCTTQPLAIIGAGLSGLCLALALHQQNIPCVIYESRPAPLDIGGAIMLSPNALQILDKLGIYKRLEPRGYAFEKLYFQNDNKLLDTFEFGSKEKYGYSGMRVYRYELIQIMLDMISEAGIKPHYGKKFARITKEDEDGVSWEFEDGTTGQAPLLIGADGIHSRVRSYIYPQIAPIFTNMAGISAVVPTKQADPSGESNLPVTIMNKDHGAFVAAPQRKEGSELFVGKQFRYAEERDREGWEQLLSDKSWCVDFLRTGHEDYPPIVKNIVSHIDPNTVNIWRFHIIPKLDSWVSKSGRVLILGDAAHAIPPTAGQGVNQAFEDVYTFAKVVARGGLKAIQEAPQVLRNWQQKRQSRIDGVLQLNDAINKRRLPAQNGESIVTEPFDLHWLYGVDFDAMADEMAGN
jgi:2-polyprenyl-6-methoxyphenol hydroxylase-like FAD-dependent oxidoreductase